MLGYDRRLIAPLPDVLRLHDGENRSGFNPIQRHRPGPHSARFFFQHPHRPEVAGLALPPHHGPGPADTAMMRMVEGIIVRHGLSIGTENRVNIVAPSIKQGRLLILLIALDDSSWRRNRAVVVTQNRLASVHHVDDLTILVHLGRQAGCAACLHRHNAKLPRPRRSRRHEPPERARRRAFLFRHKLGRDGPDHRPADMAHFHNPQAIGQKLGRKRRQVDLGPRRSSQSPRGAARVVHDENRLSSRNKSGR